MKTLPLSSLFGFLIFTMSLHAQEVTGTLEGRIVDTTFQAVVGANIAVESPTLQGIRGTISDERGFFRMPQLPPGIYKVKISHIGHTPALLSNVKIGLGRTTSLGEVRLSSETIQVGEVVITGEQKLLDPQSTTVGGNLLVSDVEVLPLERNYRSVAALLPHANQSFLGDETNHAGASGAENRYFINGTDVTDSYRGITGTNLPYNLIREVQVKTGGYEPEYRSSLGGVLNVITYSGGNKFSGQVFGFFTNNNFSSEYQVPASQPPKGSYAQYDFGFSVGGPIVQDELWFYAAYSPTFSNEDIMIPGLGYYPDKITANPFAAKLTWRASQTVDVTTTVLGDPTAEEGVGKRFWGSPTPLQVTNPDPYLANANFGGYGVMLDGKFVASDNTLLQGSVSWTSRKNKYMPATEVGGNDPWFYDNETGTLSGGYSDRVDIASTAVSASVAATVNLGSHTLKTGLEYKDVGLDSYNKVQKIYRYGDSSYLVYDISQVGAIHNRLPSAFMQDSWSLSDHFRINAGLRWDGLFLVASDGKVAQEILGQFQPRFGVVFLPGSEERHKIFATVGRFAEDLLTFGSTIYHIGDAYQAGYSYTHDPRADPSGKELAFYYGGSIQQNLSNLRGQYYDEAVLGYEEILAQKTKVTAKGIYRTLKEIVEDAESVPGSGIFYYANPGRPPLSSYPKPRREYLALELSVESSPCESFNILASYVLSRNYGNYTGLYYQDDPLALPNAGPHFDYVDLLVDATGLLPNDRTHVIKVNGSYGFSFGLNLGASFLWQSGTPLNELGGSVHGPSWPMFIQPRGTAGRLPSVWDLNLRLTYDLRIWQTEGVKPRLILDIFHVGNQRTVVQQDQIHYWNQDSQGNQIDPNPTYGQPMRFMPPRSMRLGMEVSF